MENRQSARKKAVAYAVDVNEEESKLTEQDVDDEKQNAVQTKPAAVYRTFRDKKEYYIGAAFRSLQPNEVFMFIVYDFVVIRYDPATSSDVQILKGPIFITEAFPSLLGTFQSYGVSAAFGCHGVAEAFIFSVYECAKIKYSPQTRTGSVIEGPELTKWLFPDLETTNFRARVDAAFESSVHGQAYLFCEAQYALIDYCNYSLVAIGFITEEFPCLKNTIFEDIGAAFASHTPNEAYLFKDNNFLRLHFAPGRPDSSYIVECPKEIVPDNWPCLKGLLPYPRVGLSFPGVRLYGLECRRA